ncbi:MAG: glycosyltransferase family 4 protein [Chromatiales bacterium]|nr:glycosyltransferase family 4 protein [Chromatiales bacterium]
MKVLVLAPHPFYQERGTPIAVDLLLRALSERGDEVDLLTFHEGSDKVYSGLKIKRISPWLPVNGIKPGFSVKKLVCDVLLMGRFMYLMAIKKYDVVHAVEESAFMAMLICPIRRIPYVYDMDSSMTTQLVDKFGVLKKFENILRWVEGLPMRFSKIVMPMCDVLADEARARGAKSVVVLKDVSLVGNEEVTSSIADLKGEFGTDKKIVMYIGNLESYQGIDLLLDSVNLIYKELPELIVTIIGGADDDIEKYEKISRSLGMDGVVHFLGKKPVADIGAYMSQADILVSPRVHGINTPMKVYSYLHSNTVVLATDLPTHTQVMNGDIGMLAAPEKQAYADGMLELIHDDELRVRLSKAAHQHIEKEHSYEAFKQHLYEAYEQLELTTSKHVDA